MDRQPKAMTAGGDNRGVSELAGAVLVFAALIITLSVYQATVVPMQNERTEFNHNLRVQTDIQDLRRAIINAPWRGTTESVTIELGVRYTARAILVNPAPAAGSLRTDSRDAPNISIVNAVGRGDIGDFWDGNTQQYETRHIVYEPAYNQYTDAPATRYENSVVYNRFNSTTINLTDQQLIDGRRITLIAISGSVDRNGIGDTSIDIKSVSPGHRTVTVKNSSSPIQITIPTKLDLAIWQDLLDGEFVANGTGGHIQSVSIATDPSGFNLLTVELEPGVTYELRLSNVVVDDAREPASLGYVKIHEGNLSSMTTDEERALSVEVRNRFNNPLSGETVTFTTNSTNVSLSDTKVVSDEEGRAKVILSASGTANATITAGIDSDGDGDLSDEAQRLVVTFKVFVNAN